MAGFGEREENYSREYDILRGPVPFHQDEALPQTEYGIRLSSPDAYTLLCLRSLYISGNCVLLALSIKIYTLDI